MIRAPVVVRVQLVGEMLVVEFRADIDQGNPGLRAIGRQPGVVVISQSVQLLGDVPGEQGLVGKSGTFSKTGARPPSRIARTIRSEVPDDPGAGPLDLGPRPEVVGAVTDDEQAGVREQLQVVADLPRAVLADLARDAAVGDRQSKRSQNRWRNSG